MSAALKGWCSLGQRPAWFSRSSLRCLFCIWRLSFVLVFHSGVIFHWERANRQSCDHWSGLLHESRCVNEGWSPLPLHTNGSNISINASEACPSPFSEGDKTVWPLTILKQWCMCYQLGHCAGVQEIFRLSALSKRATTCCSHLGGHPGEAFGSTSEAGYRFDVPEHPVQLLSAASSSLTWTLWLSWLRKTVFLLLAISSAGLKRAKKGFSWRCLPGCARISRAIQSCH